jgi:hypothetical protein
MVCFAACTCCTAPRRGTMQQRGGYIRRRRGRSDGQEVRVERVQERRLRSEQRQRRRRSATARDGAEWLLRCTLRTVSWTKCRRSSRPAAPLPACAQPSPSQHRPQWPDTPHHRPAQPCSSFRGHSLQWPKWSQAVPSGVVRSVAPQSPPPQRYGLRRGVRRSKAADAAAAAAALELTLRWACLLELGLHLLLHGAVGLEQRLQFRAQLHRSASDHSGAGGEAKARRPTVALASTRLTGVALPPASVGTAAAK